MDHRDIMKGLSGANLRKVGTAIKATRPGWQKADIQVMPTLNGEHEKLWDAGKQEYLTVYDGLYKTRG